MTQDTEVCGEIFKAGVSPLSLNPASPCANPALPTPQTILSVPSYTIHHLESVYTDPMEYRPERWLEEGGKDLPLNVFSFGPRSCVGRK
jgi:benzoate 4-monooxygenase